MLEGIEFLTRHDPLSLEQDPLVAVCQQYIESIEKRISEINLSEKQSARMNSAIYSINLTIDEMRKVGQEQSSCYIFAIMNGIASLNEVLLTILEDQNAD